jgi:MFS family permease
MKFPAAAMIRRFGFKRLLIVNGVLASATIAVTGLMSPHYSYWLILPVLFAGGFLRSLQFTAMNAMSYADMESPQMSHATSLYTVIQHLSLSAGVVLAAVVLEAAQYTKGETALSPFDFGVAFAVVAAFSLLSILWFRRLSPDAGSAVSGRGQVD